MILFIQTQKQKSLSMKVTLVMCFNQSILQLYQTHQRLYEKVQAELLIVIDHAISISKHDPLAGSSYIKLPRELRYPRKGLIYIQNIDDIACFK